MEDLDRNFDGDGHWLDHLYLRLKSKESLFSKGWGDEKLTKKIVNLESLTEKPRPLNIHFMRREEEKKYTSLEAVFKSPYVDFPLPKNSEQGFLEFILPKGVDLFQKGSKPPLILLMPASGDDTFSYRKKKIAIPLAQKGIASVLLEIPFYGRRKPDYQEETNIGLVSDFALMLYMSYQEGRSILYSFFKNGFYHLGVSGFSMGGFFASGIAASLPFPVALVAALTGNTIADTLVYGHCQQSCHWNALMGNQSKISAQKKLYKILNFIGNLEVLPPPSSLTTSLLINAQEDAYIPPINAKKLKLLWKGVDQVWLPGGHFTAIFKGAPIVVDALELAIKNLKYPRRRGLGEKPFQTLHSFSP